MLIFLFLIPFLTATSFLFLPRRKLAPNVPWLASLMASGACVLILGYATFVPSASGPREFFAEWVPIIGLNLSLWLDGPALVFAWIVCGLGFLIFLYAGFYLDPKDSPWRFFGTMLLFMGAMVGVVIARNVLLMYLFWELTSVTSFILIGHWHEKESAREGAIRALVVTITGGLCLMAGIAGWFWILKDTGISGERALDWDQLWANREVLLNHFASPALLALVLLGAFTKSAQFPFHFWLPGAMEAPTPVSAFLHAATMVKAGIYLLGRLYPIYWDYELWLILVGGIGCITMLVGGVMALLSHDLKQLLAHSTVSQLGLLTAYYGFGYMLADSETKLPLDLLLVVSHALFKGGLFLLVGIIDHGTHTRDWTRLGGLFKKMPATGILTIIGCASMAGIPLTFGFVAKELFLKMSIHLHTDIVWLKYGLPGLAIFASLFTVAYCLRMAISPFFGKQRDDTIQPHEGSIGLLISPAIMIGLCLLGGLFVPILETPIASAVRDSFYGVESGFNIAFFHHIDILLGIAVFLFSVGAVVFLLGEKIEDLYWKIHSPAPFLGAYNKIFNQWIPDIAAWLARTCQSPSLSRNAMLTLGVAFAAVIGAMVFEGFLPALEYEANFSHITAAALVLLSLPCLYIVLTHKVLLVRVIAMTPIGLFVTLFFLLFKAPDLALTQILIEAVVLLVLLMMLFHLPQRFKRLRRPAGSALPRAVVAITGGTVMGLLVFAASNSTLRNQSSYPGNPNYPNVGDYYLANTKYSAYKDDPEGGEAAGYPGAEKMRSGGGKNAVNVILVDFRGTDTMGEITVLGIAAIGVMALLSMGGRLPKGEDESALDARAAARKEIETINSGEEPQTGSPLLQIKTWPTPSIILRELGRLIPAILMLVAVVLFFAGHNGPGGGFIAGLMASVALVVILVGFRRADVEQLYRFRYRILIPTGLFFAVGTGLAAPALGFPFLSSAFTYINLPWIGEVEIATAMFFDLGVFLTVVGVTMLIIEKLGRE